MIKIPYGISHFPTMIENNYFYQDRTMFMRKLEEEASPYLFFLRPRRFGKSLFVSTLLHYYGLEFKNKSEQLFGALAIGQNPTPLANSFLVLSFEFSRIMTDTIQNTYDGFLFNVKQGVRLFLKEYEVFFPNLDFDKVVQENAPNKVLSNLLEVHRLYKVPHNIFILIDEYDHFANELISFHFDYFKEAVSQNGFVRKFYETIKTATGMGIVQKFFATGVSPITLDSMTSGFNIASNISLDILFYQMLGFVEEEVENILENIGVEKLELPIVLADLRNWYDGYLFNIKSPKHIYNPDMVLYFAQFYKAHKSYPNNLLDPNIATDYSKIRNVFRIQNRETDNLAVLRTLSETGRVSAQLTDMFNFEKVFSHDDLASLLFYMGFLTIEKADFAGTVFKFPNFVIERLYSEYFVSFLQSQAHLPIDNSKMNASIRSMARTGNPQPFFDQVSEILKNLSNRDAFHFNEMSLKAILVSCLHQQQFYYVHSEYETSKGYVDVFLEAIRGYDPDYQIAIELKYIKKSDDKDISVLLDKADTQLTDYLVSKKFVTRKGLKGFVVIVKGDDLTWREHQHLNSRLQ